MRRFADQGFRATAVGDIEAAVGLQPRRGALYKHFPSKRALLDEAVRTHLDRASAGAAQISELPLTTAIGADRAGLRPLVVRLGRWFLDEMDRMENLTRVVEHDGERMAELSAEIKTDIVDLGYRTAATVVAALAPASPDPVATAVIVLGALVALRRTAWTFGSAPLDIDDDRALEAWADLILAAVDAAGKPGRP